jgi:hypothetical protein
VRLLLRLQTHLAAPAVYYEHVQREAVCGVEHVRLTDVEAQVTLVAAAAVMAQRSSSSSTQWKREMYAM